VIPRKKKAAPAVKVVRGEDHSVITPRNLLKAKAAVMIDRSAGIDEAAVRRAEQALKALSVNFNVWMEEALRKLGDARERLRRDPPPAGSLAALHRAAHDIRGQASMLGFPLAARVGASLCRILEECPPPKLREGMVAAVVDQHVDAIRAIVREGVTNATMRTGEILANELEAITDRLLASADQILH
jgi:chemotaxis protein histidine kinase CheA